uniref:Uncharacterized protein n=1 Tax=Ascaris lumbricoides TaxID=6252 RepID=A0A0M3ITU0_ASCLU
MRCSSTQVELQGRLIKLWFFIKVLDCKPVAQKRSSLWYSSPFITITYIQRL